MNRYSTQWVTDVPSADGGEGYSAAELAVIAATYLGLEVPVFAGLVGVGQQ